MVNSGLLGQKTLVLNCGYLGGLVPDKCCIQQLQISQEKYVRKELNQFDGAIKHFQFKWRLFYGSKENWALPSVERWWEHKQRNEFQCVVLAMCDVRQHLGAANGVIDPTTQSPLGCAFCLQPLILVRFPSFLHWNISVLNQTKNLSMLPA